MASTTLAKLIALLATEKLLAAEKQSSIEIAETLWLALQIDPTDPAAPSDAVDEAREPLPAPILPNADPPPPPARPAEAAKPCADLAIHQAGVLPTAALPVWIADPSMLKDPLKVMQALKPLLAQVAAGTGQRLDEPATVDRIARTRLWLPVMEPETEPWFDIILVVDSGASMHLWQRLIKDLELTFRRYGAFRNLQRFDIDIISEGAKDTVRLKSHPERSGHLPSELIEQNGRRIAIVLSDCAGEYWWDGTLLPMLETWAKVMPTVVWQMLPEWMWERTALGQGKAIALTNDNPGAANQQLKRSPIGRKPLSDTDLKQLPVPVMTSEPRDLRNWSLMLAGDRRESTPGFLLAGAVGRRAMAINKLKRDSEPSPEAMTAEQRVQRFLQLSSPSAQRLVMLLAAAPVVTLPVMRLIRETMLSDAQGNDEARSPLPVAEVFLSGLLDRLSGQAAGSEAEMTSDSLPYDLVQYAFAQPVRKALLSKLPEVDTIDVINRVSSLVENRWNAITTQDFRAFLTNPNVPAPEGLATMRSFATVMADILETLDGSRHREFVDQLRQGSEGGSSKPDDEVEPFPPLRTFEFLRAQVREQIGIVPVQFEFEVARLVAQRSGLLRREQIWKVQKERRAAYQVVELLDEETRLEMVVIPGGTFLMGSPEDEIDRWSDESPQHEVRVEAFCMGRYPITQAQWRFVAGLEPINKELKADPSNFKGDDRPVENVTWEDAVEYCDRLSRHSQKQYQLPTEAQWEYACRAGTTTPFHFGETITTDIANYRGTDYTDSQEREWSGSYGDGPKGVCREETTAVDYFEMANDFGLCDMHGNVWEWCADHWHDNYEGAPKDGTAWLIDLEELAREELNLDSEKEEEKELTRVIRGGSWDLSPRNCRAAARDFIPPANRYPDVGFRICCAAPRALP